MRPSARVTAGTSVHRHPHREFACSQDMLSENPLLHEHAAFGLQRCQIASLHPAEADELSQLGPDSFLSRQFGRVVGVQPIPPPRLVVGLQQMIGGTEELLEVYHRVTAFFICEMSSSG